MKGRGRTGFYEYLETGEYTPGFIGDVDVLISKVYRRWSLYETYDEFHSFCWAKIVRSIKAYDDSIGPLSTYLYQVITNEARRIWSKHRKMALEEPSEDPSEDVWFSGVVDGLHRSDFGLRARLCAFARRAHLMGVHVDQGVLYRNYCSGKNSSGVRAFKWCAILGVK